VSVFNVQLPGSCRRCTSNSETKSIDCPCLLFARMVRPTAVRHPVALVISVSFIRKSFVYSRKKRNVTSPRDLASCWQIPCRTDVHIAINSTLAPAPGRKQALPVPPPRSRESQSCASVVPRSMHLRLPAVEYEYRVKTAALDTLKRYSILSLTLYLE
jgi:hypothetical protein